ncbi:hypothetical protein ACNKGU_00020 [Acinetobacter baumannii]
MKKTKNYELAAQIIKKNLKDLIHKDTKYIDKLGRSGGEENLISV